MDEPEERAENSPDDRANVKEAQRALKVFQIHAAHRRKADEALGKLSAEVSDHLGRLGIPVPEGAQWPALSAASEIVSQLPPEMQDKVLSRLPEEIRAQTVELLYSFDSIQRQPARVIQKLLQAVDKRTLATALIGADENVHAAVAANMSSRATTMLEEDIESLIRAGDLSTRDVREAREAVGAALYGTRTENPGGPA